MPEQEPFGVRIEAYDDPNITLRVRYTLNEAASAGKIQVTGPGFGGWAQLLTGSALAVSQHEQYITIPQTSVGRYTIHVKVYDDRALSDKMQRAKETYLGTWYVLSRVMVVGIKFTTDGADGYNPIYLDDQGVKTELPQWKYHVRQEGDEAQDGELVRERNQPITHPIHISGQNPQNPRIWVRADLRNLARELDAAHPTPWFRVKLVAYAKRRGTSTVTDLTVYAKDDEVTSPPSPYVIGYIPVEVDHEDYDVFYWALGDLPEVVGAWDLTLHWEFEWSDADTGPWLPLGGQDTTHVLYTTVHDPLPMRSPIDDWRHPWGVVLDKACAWAAAAGTDSQAAAGLVDRAYGKPVFNYNGNVADSFGDVVSEEYYLDHYLANSSRFVTTVDGQCTDVAGLLTILARALGLAFENVVIDNPSDQTPYYFAHPDLMQELTTRDIDPVGLPGWAPTAWNYHELCVCIGYYDACLRLDAADDPNSPSPVVVLGLPPADYENLLWRWAAASPPPTGEAFTEHKRYVPVLKRWR